MVVTINYRLGPFGFLSFHNITRNIGLHDQRVALQWIHENIIYFGGNKSRMTLSGWSSGGLYFKQFRKKFILIFKCFVKGASVSYHMYANQSKDLFDKAIMMSGNMLNPWAFESDVVRCTYELLKKLYIQNSTYAMQELKAIDAYDLIPPLFTNELKIIFFGSGQFCFVPTIDDDFVTQPPHIISHQNTPSNIPILLGTTSLESEWILSLETNNFKYPNKNLDITKFMDDLMSQVFEHDYDSIEEDHFIRNFQPICDISYGIYKFIQNYIDLTEQKNVFLYRFAVDSDSNKKNKGSIGAVHGDELKYIFKDNFLEENATQCNKTNLLNERMVAMWTNFIKFG